MKKFTRNRIIFFSFLTLLYLKLETYHTINGNFAFAYDQGRDLFEAAKIAFEGNIPFIGPTTGLQGIFYGPWWYYLLAIPTFISKGNPGFVALIFSMIGWSTLIALFFILFNTTKSFLISAFFSYIALVSSLWMLSPTLIWSPTLVPITMILFIYSFFKIIKTQKIIYYFLYGLSSQLILNGEVAYGVMVTLWLVLTVFLFKKHLFNKKLAYTFAGILILWLPQILFEIKNNFLETKAVVSYLKEPKIYGEQLAIAVRLIQRLSSINNLLAQALFSNNKLFSILFMAYLVASAKIIYSKLKPSSAKNLLNYICLFLLFSVIFFTLFQDRVWDYYLVGIPITTLIASSLILSNTLKHKFLKYFTYIFLLIILILNIPVGIFETFDEKKAIDGSAYVNTKRVMDFITSQQPVNYSLYVFSPAIFDPPYDYMTYWYTKQGLIQAPKPDQSEFYLIIREYSSKKYLSTGWYGDKTKDKSEILESKEFIGDITVEKHKI